jgi:hypothetical protein
VPIHSIVQTEATEKGFNHGVISNIVIVNTYAGTTTTQEEAQEM